MDELLDVVLEVVRSHGDDPRLSDPGTELAAVGIASLRTVELLVELEARLGLAIPDDLFEAERFRTPRAIAATLDEARTRAGA